jgi:hypothetical protein
MKPELRVFLRRTCLINPPPALPPVNEALGGIVTSLLPKVIDVALGGIASLLKKAGADETEQVSGSEIVSLFSADKDQRLAANREVGCILAVYGVFANVDRRPTADSDSALEALEAANLVPKDADIAIILELAVVRTTDETAFYLEARHFSVRDFIGGRNKPERSYIATLALTAPNATADGATIALGHVALGRMERKEFLAIPSAPLGSFPRYRSNLMPWNQISDEAKEAYDSDVKRGEAAGKSYMPVTLSLTLSETADGNKFFAKLGELLEGSREEVGKQITALVDPAARAKTVKESADAAEKLWAAEEDAGIAVREAEAALAAGKPEEKAVLEAKLAKAKRALEVAARLRKAAGLGDLPHL